MDPIVTSESIDHGDSEIEIMVTQLETLSVQSELQNSASGAEIPSTFHGFTKLPKELQLLIIRFHCEIPRLVPIWLRTGVFPIGKYVGHHEHDQEDHKYVDYDVHDQDDNDNYVEYEVFSTDSPEPSIMMVNKEIREEVLQSGVYQNLFFETKVVLTDWHGLYATYCTNIWVNKNDLVCPTIKGERKTWRHRSIYSFGKILNDSKVERILLDDLSSHRYTRWRDRWGGYREYPFQEVYISTFLTPHVREIAFYVPKTRAGISPSAKFIANRERTVVPGNPQNIRGWTADQQLLEVMNTLDGLKESRTQFTYDANMVERLKYAAEWLYKTPELFVRPSITFMEIVGDD